MSKNALKESILPSVAGPFNYMHQTKKNNFNIALSLHKVNLYALIDKDRYHLLADELGNYADRIRPLKTKNNMDATSFELILKGKRQDITLRDSYYKKYHSTRVKSPYILQTNKPLPSFCRFLYEISSDIKWSISSAEFACDMIGPDLNGIFSFAKKHVFMTWRGQSFLTNYNSTIYLNNVRKSKGIGGKIYLNPKEKPDRVRIELTGKNIFFKRNKIHTLYDLLATRPEDIFKRVPFRDIIAERFERHLAREDKKSGSLPQAKARLQEMYRAWNERGIHAARDVIARYYVNPSYCLQVHPFQDEFMSAMRGLSFSDGIRWKRNSEGMWLPVGWIKRRRSW